MDAIVESSVADVTAVVDPAVEGSLASLEELLAAGVDGVVIATPSALHAGQALAALENGAAVFCQKPLALDAPTAARVVEAAKAVDRLLEVDLSYRFTDAAQQVKKVVASGDLGEIVAVDLTFHNRHGADKAWSTDPALAGGGCVLDLGIHLVDLALWALDFPPVRKVTSRLHGEPLEHYAAAQIELDSGTVLRLSCSWKLPVGRDCAVEASFYGTRGGASLRNVGGSFVDLVAERFDATTTTVLSEPPDEWGGRAAIDWARKLGEGAGFDASAVHYVSVHEVLDLIYQGTP
jgi:predicted dehydrogenase